MRMNFPRIQFKQKKIVLVIFMRICSSPEMDQSYCRGSSICTYHNYKVRNERKNIS